MVSCRYPARVLACFCYWVVLARNNLGVASTSNDDYSGCEGDTDLLGDAVCDLSVNTADCGFDGGDCCECTCVDTDDNECGEGGGGFFCQDPDVPPNCGPTVSPTPAPTAAPSESPYPGCEGYLPHIQDGFCDEQNNSAECGWDGGDCCACTCLEDLNHECGVLGDGYDCRDPDVPPDCAEANLALCPYDTYSFQNGHCDDDLNSAECGYDGGDCCRCTCRDYYPNSYYSSYNTNFCGRYGYDCVDPNAPTDCDTASPTPSPAASTPYPDCEGFLDWITDGSCDSTLNNPECDYDGGDCCITCTSCIDPDAECESTTEDDYTFFYDYPSYGYTSTSYEESAGGACAGGDSIGDGYCDSSYNNVACDWDGGDCCSCTCVDANFDCGIAGYSCQDVDASCADDDGGERSTPTPSPVTDGAEVVASSVGSSTTMSTTSIVGGFTIAFIAYCCFGGAIMGALILIRNKCRGHDGDEESNAQAGTMRRVHQKPFPILRTVSASGVALPPVVVSEMVSTGEEDGKDGESKEGEELGNAHQDVAAP